MGTCSEHPAEPQCYFISTFSYWFQGNKKARKLTNGSGLARSHWSVDGTSGIDSMYSFLFLATELTFKLPEKLLSQLFSNSAPLSP